MPCKRAPSCATAPILWFAVRVLLIFSRILAELDVNSAPEFSSSIHTINTGHVERVTFSGLVPGGMPEEWRAILPQSFPKREVYVCEGKCLKDVKETKCYAGNETQVGEDGRCSQKLRSFRAITVVFSMRSDPAP